MIQKRRRCLFFRKRLSHKIRPPVLTLGLTSHVANIENIFEICKIFNRNFAKTPLNEIEALGADNIDENAVRDYLIKCYAIEVFDVVGQR